MASSTEIDLEFRGGLNLEELPEDKLNRQPFARQLVMSLQHQKSKSSIVVGLSGEWGSGKSWIIANVRRLLNDDYDKAIDNSLTQGEGRPPTTPYSFEFQAWQWSGTEGIISQFFDQLTEEIRIVEADEMVRKSELLPKWWRPVIEFMGAPWKKARCFFTTVSTSKKLQAYSACFTAHSTVIGGYNKAFVGLLGFFTLASGAYGWQQADWFPIFTSVIFAALAVANGVVSFIADSFSKQAEAKEKMAKANEKTPRALKYEISKRLMDLPHPIIIILDDLDRLTSSEIAQVFQLIKTQADFPNIHYLLGFDRNLIAGALEKDAPGLPVNGLPDSRGHHFLEKIVPVIFDLPSVNNDDFREILCKDLNSIFDLSLCDNSRWLHLWSESLSFYFTNLRSIERFQNSLKFNLHLLGGKGESINVDALDFIGIETIRLFEPNVFSLLARNRDLMTKDRSFERLSQNQNSSNAQSPHVPSQDEKSVEKIFESAIVNKDAAKMLLCHLFPEVGKMIKPKGFQPTYSDVACPSYAGRVSDPIFFSRLFRYALGPNEWSGQEVSDVMKDLGNPLIFAQTFQEVADGKKTPGHQSQATSAHIQLEDIGAQSYWSNTLSLCGLVGERIINISPALSSSEIIERKQTALSLLKAGMVLPVNTHYIVNQKFERQFGAKAHRVLLAIEDVSKRESISLEILTASNQTFASNLGMILEELGSHNQTINQPKLIKEKFLLLSPDNLHRAQLMVAGQIQTALESESESDWQRSQMRLYLEAIHVWGDQNIEDRSNKLLEKMLYDDKQCFWLLEAFLDIVTVNQMSMRVLMIDDKSLQSDGGKCLSDFIPIWVLQNRIPQLEKYLFDEIHTSSEANDLASSILSPKFDRRLSCLIGLKNYFGAKQQPPVKTSLQEEISKISRSFMPQ